MRATSPGRTDMILVNKFACWFSKLKRGDILVFKVPDKKDQANNPFDPTKPVYIKRCIGLPGEEIALNPVKIETHRYGAPGFVGSQKPIGLGLARNPDTGKDEPVAIQLGPGVREHHVIGQPMTVDGKGLDPDSLVARIAHYPPPGGLMPTDRDDTWHRKVREDEVFMFGDNGASSSDSRYWGGVPLKNLRGKAVLRYLPFKAFGFLK